MEHSQRRPCHAGTLPAGTVAPGSVPAPAARHRNGEQTPPPTICTGTHPAQQIAPPVQTEGQSSSARRAAALAFFFCAAFPPARPAGSAARHALGVVPPRGKAGKYPGSAGRSTWILRPPPAPGGISTASAAPDDHASSRPPHTMTTHQRQPRPTCTAPTACQPCQTCQTSQRQRSRQRHPPGRTSPPAPPTCRLHRCRLPDDPPRSTPQNGHFAPPPEGSDSPPNGIEL